MAKFKAPPRTALPFISMPVLQQMEKTNMKHENVVLWVMQLSLTLCLLISNKLINIRFQKQVNLAYIPLALNKHRYTLSHLLKIGSIRNTDTSIFQICSGHPKVPALKGFHCDSVHVGWLLSGRIHNLSQWSILRSSMKSLFFLSTLIINTPIVSV